MPVVGSSLSQVATSAVEVMMTGSDAVPLTKICEPVETARLPPRPVVLATMTPASMVRVAPERT